MCYDSCCINKLIWDSDGSILKSWADTNHGIIVPDGDECLRYESTYMVDKNCTALYDYICEFKCPSVGIATSTTMTTPSTSTALTTTVTNTTCQPPSGYTYETCVDKYYKPVKAKVTWQTAKDACSSEGSMLVELRTSAEYHAIRPVYGKSFNRLLIAIN